MNDSVASDARNNPITLGAHVKYIGTHTRGKVKEIQTDEGHQWVLLDTTNLLYDPKHLEVVNEATEKVVDREVQSLDEFRKRLEEKRESLQTARESFDEPGG